MPQVAIKKVSEEGKGTLAVFNEMAQRFEEIERRAYELFEKRGRENGHELEDWLHAEHELLGWPAGELAEKDGAYEMRISLPGFEAKDVEVTATPNEIVVHAASKGEKKEEKGNVLWTEFGSRDIYRRFEVPKSINADKVTANLENGLLRIKAPEVANPKRSAAQAA
jgi:HSP20 family protein